MRSQASLFKLGFVVAVVAACLIALPVIVVAQQGSAKSVSSHVPAAHIVSAPGRGKSIVQRISGGETHSYRVTLAVGQFARVTVEQRGADVALSLSGPDGKKLLDVDSPNGNRGPEPVSWIAEQAGDYKLEVTASGKEAGSYEIKMVELRKAVGKDRSHVEAIRAFMEAEQLVKKNTAESTKSAITKYEEALAQFRNFGDRYGEGLSLSYLGSAYKLLGESEKALDQLTQSSAIWRDLKRNNEQARTLKEIARVYHSSGQYEKSVSFLSQSQALWEALNANTEVANILLDSGVVYTTLGDYTKALAAFTKSVPLLEKNGDRRREATALNNIGFIYTSLGEPRKSLAVYERALPLRRAIADRPGEATTLNNIGWAQAAVGENQTAVSTLGEALTIWRTVGARAGEAFALVGLGNAYNNSGRRKEALRYYGEALGIYRDIKKPEGEALALQSQMLVWRAENNTRLAIIYGKQAVNVYQALRQNIKGLDKATQATFLKSKESVYRAMAEMLISDGRLGEAQQTLRMLKEEEYFDFVRRNGNESSSLNGRSELSPAEAELAKRYEEVSTQIVTRGRQRNELLAKEKRTAEEDQMLSKFEEDLNVAGRSFQTFLDRMEAEFGNSKQAARVEQLRESQGMMEDLREMGRGAVALYTVVGDEKYRVILVTPDVQLAREYPIKSADLNEKVAAFREALQVPSRDPLPLAKELYKILVAPVAKDLKEANAETLMWSLDGALRYAPMAALHDGEKFLVESYRNVVFTPASMARLKDEPTAKWKGLGFGVSKAHQDFTALPGVPDELRGVFGEGNLTGVIEGKVMLDETFTEESMKAALRQRAPVVHIASHFSFRPGNETQSYLLLGDGNRLSLAAVKSAQNLFGGVEMLTLSACDTASGGTGADGKEVEGFAVLAQRQGAKAVVASLWPVADASTKQLMQNFYRLRESESGMLKVEALRRAQLMLLRGGSVDLQRGAEKRGLSSDMADSVPKTGDGKGDYKRDPKAPYAHPFFWAPFILIGNWK